MGLFSNIISSVKQGITNIGNTLGIGNNQATQGTQGTQSSLSNPTQAAGTNPFAPTSNALTNAINKNSGRNSGSNIVQNSSSPTGYSDTLGQPVSVAPEALPQNQVPEGATIYGSQGEYTLNGQDYTVEGTPLLSGTVAPVTAGDVTNAATLGMGGFTFGLTKKAATLGGEKLLGITGERVAGGLIGYSDDVAKTALGSLDDFLAVGKAGTNTLNAGKAIINAEKAGSELVATRGLVGETAEAAAGITKAAGTSGIVNTVTTANRLSFLQKAVNFAKSPMFIIGTVASWVTTGVLSQNEWGDTVQALSIAISTAEKAGDTETARELNEYLEDISPTRMKAWLGPIAYLGNVDKKIESGVKIAEQTMSRIEEAEEKKIATQIMEDKIQAGYATEQEIAKYIGDNPYSQLTALIKQNEKNQQYAESAIALQTQLEQIKNQGADYRNSLYNSDTTGNTGSTYETPSSLNFGLLHTSGGYESTNLPVVGTSTTAGKLTEPQQNEVSQYLFGIPYSQLTEEQKAVVDKW